jgi:DNA polymerase I-like protein with 3'-5' exonuclease and polymerase domains
MKIIAFDFETFLIGYPDQIAPTPVCMSWATMDGEGNIEEQRICATQDIPHFLSQILLAAQDGTVDSLVCANSAFELSKICVYYTHMRPIVCELLRDGKIWDVQIMEKLKLISTNGDPDFKSCSLAALVWRYLHEDLSHLKEGPDIWRLRYSELYNKPISEYPEAAILYSISDSVNTARVFFEICKTAQPYGVGSINTAPLQTAFDFYARMMTINGFDLDQERVSELETNIRTLITPSKEYLMEYGYMTKMGNKKKKKLQEYILEKFGEDVPRSAKGGVSTKSDDLKKFPPDPLIDMWIEYMTYEKLLTTYIPQMMFDKVHCNYNCIVKTGRSSSRSSNYYKWKILGKSLKHKHPYPSMNAQNLPRSMDIRPAFRAGPGKVLIVIDYGQLELCSIAQFSYRTFGISDLRDKINEGRDMHSDLACDTLGISYEEFMERRSNGDKKILRARQQHKPVTLGVFGGQGHKRIQEEINKYLPKNKHITEEDAKHLKQVAIGRYREAKLFFGEGHGFERVPGFIDSLHNGNTKYNEEKNRDEDLFAFEVNGRYHNNRTYCATANGITMQSLSADGAKAAVCKVGEASLLEGNILSGCQMKAFIHDEIIIEVPNDDKIEERMDYMASLMIEAMHKVMPDMRITVEASVMDRWLKNGPFIMEKKIWRDPVNVSQSSA